jgi:PAS domain S-box-containing protein
MMGFYLNLQRVRYDLEGAAVEAVTSFDRFFQDIESDLRLTAAGLADRSDVNAVLLSLRSMNSAFMDVIYAAPDGRVVAQRNGIGRPVRAKLGAGEWPGSIPAFGTNYTGPLAFEGQTPYVDMAAGATDGIGLSAGILCVRVDLTALWNATLDIKVGDSGYAYIVEDSGQLVAYRNRQLVKAGHTLQALVGRDPRAMAARFAPYRGLEGFLVLSISRPLRSVPWFAIVEQPIYEALRTLWILGPLSVILIALAVYVCLGSIWFARRRIVLPLLALRDAVGNVAQGRIEQHIAVERADELGQLAGSFNIMSAKLRQAFCDLEDQIAELTATQSALKSKSDELDRYFTYSLDLLCIADVDGYFRRLNPEWERALGYTRAELEGKRFLDFVHPEDIEKTMAAVSSLGRQEKVLHFENRNRHKDGTYRWIEWSTFPAGDLIYAAARDVTGRKEAEAALEARMAELIEWRDLTLGREGRVMELKEEVNRLLAESGRPPKYADPAIAASANGRPHGA